MVNPFFCPINTIDFFSWNRSEGVGWCPYTGEGLKIVSTAFLSINGNVFRHSGGGGGVPICPHGLRVRL